MGVSKYIFLGIFILITISISLCFYFIYADAFLYLFSLGRFNKIDKIKNKEFLDNLIKDKNDISINVLSTIAYVKNLTFLGSYALIFDYLKEIRHLDYYKIEENHDKKMDSKSNQ